MATTRALSFHFVRVSQVKLLNTRVEGASSCVRDENMLESAVNSPINQQRYGNENDPARLAATLSYRLIIKSCFRKWEQTNSTSCGKFVSTTERKDPATRPVSGGKQRYHHASSL